VGGVGGQTVFGLIGSLGVEKNSRPLLKKSKKRIIPKPSEAIVPILSRTCFVFI
jgi:hypothetical protein|tara:strand:+ start:39 stop:200 length:162 start_codon:yes stop_codon:yes gene_type:complete